MAHHRAFAARTTTALARFLAIAFAALALAGCSTAGGTVTLPAWLVASYAQYFNAALAEQIRSSAQFQNVDYDPAYVGVPSPVFSGHPYELIKLQVAHGAGLSGAGRLVAIVDNGFDLTHPEYASNIAFVYNPAIVNAQGHGTHVAGLIASTGTGFLRGVAPGVSLHLSTTNASMADSIAATYDARARGAVAQNNSWSFVVSGTSRTVTAADIVWEAGSNGVSFAQAFVNLVGGSVNGFEGYFQALYDFSSSGVVVFALDNDDQSSASAIGALPALFPQMNPVTYGSSGAWIAVVNGLFDINSGGTITRAYRMSQACLEAAEFCLAADGTTRSASVGGGVSSTGTGTSYAAPQVTGAVALIAQAFPNLSPNEWAKRLLASANTNIPGFTTAGITDFGNGYYKAYSLEWGQGVLDLQAALSPIGTVSTLSDGTTVQTADRHEMSSGFLTGGGAFGDGLALALQGTSFTVFDALNGDFDLGWFGLDASSFVTQTLTTNWQSAAIPKLGSATGLDNLSMGAWGLMDSSGATTIEAGDYTMGFAAVGGGAFVENALGLSSANVSNASVLSLASNTSAFYGSYDLGVVSFEQFGFAGTHALAPDGSITGVGAALSFDFAPLEVIFGAAAMAEQGAYLGMTSSGAFAENELSAINSFSLAASLDISNDLSVFAGAEYGLASGRSGGGYINSLENAAFSGFQLGLQAGNLLSDHDQLTVTVSQPLRVETGTLNLTVPVGRTPSGDIVYDTVTGSLAPSGRQLDFAVSYALLSPSGNGKFEVGAVYSLDAGHVRGNEAASIGASFTQAF